MQGLLIIDKPLGLTSHDVVYRVRRACQTRRVGHAGTLDPLASGVLLVCVGRATRLIEYLVGHDKVYEGVVRLGETTDTYDREGEIIERRAVADYAISDLDEALNPFRGAFMQIPPIYSAIKKDGRPLYKLARAGKNVVPDPRPVTVHALEILAWQRPDLTVRVHCAAGTYIRSLAHDIGQVLGCGGHLAALRRTAVGRFTLAEALPLDELRVETAAAHLQPPQVALADMPAVVLENEEVEALLNGRRVAAAAPAAGLVQLHDPAGNFWGVMRQEAGAWRPEKMFPRIKKS